jgi:hypothetical protein
VVRCGLWSGMHGMKILVLLLLSLSIALYAIYNNTLHQNKLFANPISVCDLNMRVVVKPDGVRNIFVALFDQCCHDMTFTCTTVSLIN